MIMVDPEPELCRRWSLRTLNQTLTLARQNLAQYILLDDLDVTKMLTSTRIMDRSYISRAALYESGPFENRMATLYASTTDPCGKPVSLTVQHRSGLSRRLLQVFECFTTERERAQLYNMVPLMGLVIGMNGHRTIPALAIIQPIYWAEEGNSRAGYGTTSIASGNAMLRTSKGFLIRLRLPPLSTGIHDESRLIISCTG